MADSQKEDKAMGFEGGENFDHDVVFKQVAYV